MTNSKSVKSRKLKTYSTSTAIKKIGKCILLLSQLIKIIVFTVKGTLWSEIAHGKLSVLIMLGLSANFDSSGQSLQLFVQNHWGFWVVLKVNHYISQWQKLNPVWLQIEAQWCTHTVSVAHEMDFDQLNRSVEVLLLQRNRLEIGNKWVFKRWSEHWSIKPFQSLGLLS